MPARILVVDDEPQNIRLLKTGLSGYGFEVMSTSSGQEALTIVAQRSPDAVILDVVLRSKLDGWEVCQNLREWSNVPIIILSMLDDERSKVRALDAGADDYMTKPFGMEELRARIQAVLRRTASKDTTPEKATIHIGGLHIDLVNRQVFVDGERIHLTPKQYNLLRLLATHAGKVITYRTILTQVWDTDDSGTEHYVRVFVNQIRKKLREDPERNIRYILNESGIGYRFIEQEKA